MSRKRSKGCLEYIRIRLYLMASFKDFDEMTEQKVHLYLEHDFRKAIVDKIEGYKKREHVVTLQRIARAKLRAIENPEDSNFYTQIAEEIIEDTGVDLIVLDENIVKLNILCSMYM